MDDLWSALQTTPLSVALRASIWVYPLVNTGHLLGIALLIGSVVPMDLRLLGLWPDVPVAGLERVLRPMAVFGLALALICGFLLFIARPLDYVDTALFRIKLSALMLALVNAAVYLYRWRPLRPGSAARRVPSSGEKPFAWVSLLLWLVVLLCGRLIGYR